MTAKECRVYFGGVTKHPKVDGCMALRDFTIC